MNDKALEEHSVWLWLQVSYQLGNTSVEFLFKRHNINLQLQFLLGKISYVRQNPDSAPEVQASHQDHVCRSRQCWLWSGWRASPPLCLPICHPPGFGSVQPVVLHVQHHNHSMASPAEKEHKSQLQSYASVNICQHSTGIHWLGFIPGIWQVYAQTAQGP